MEKRKIEKIISELFKDDFGNPLKLSPTQLKFAEAIALRLPVNQKQKRHIGITTTQFGKSLSLAVGILLRIVSLPDRYAVIAPSKIKAGVIMGYIIDHCFDHQLFLSQLEIDYSLERLKRERSKDRLTFRRGGEVRIFTAEQRYQRRNKEALMGFGAANLIIDESGLLSDDVYATAKRMVGGHADNFIFEIGNPFYRNHFSKTWYENKHYKKYFVDYNKAIKEGRLTKEMVDEMRGLPLFDILYECKFPDEVEMDERGFMLLVKYDVLSAAIVPQVELSGDKILGVDPAAGGDWSAYTIRTSDGGYLVAKDKTADTMATVKKVKEIVKQEKIEWEDVYIGATGIGTGIVDRLKEDDCPINAVFEGGSPEDKKRFANIKAENYWKARQWLLDGGKLKGDEFWELQNIKYKINSSGRILIEPKEELRARGMASPDFADSLAMTFAKKEYAEPQIRFG